MFVLVSCDGALFRERLVTLVTIENSGRLFRIFHQGASPTFPLTACHLPIRFQADQLLPDHRLEVLLRHTTVALRGGEEPVVLLLLLLLLLDYERRRCCAGAEVLGGEVKGKRLA